MAKTPFPMIRHAALAQPGPQTEFILGREKLHLVEVGEAVFSGDVCIPSVGRVWGREAKNSVLRWPRRSDAQRGSP